MNLRDAKKLKPGTPLITQAFSNGAKRIRGKFARLEGNEIVMIVNGGERRENVTWVDKEKP